MRQVGYLQRSKKISYHDRRSRNHVLTRGWLICHENTIVHMKSRTGGSVQEIILVTILSGVLYSDIWEEWQDSTLKQAMTTSL